MSKGKSLMLGLVVGGTVGAGITLLSSPLTGRATRNRLKEYTYSWRDFFDSLKADGFKLKDQIAETSREGVLLFKELTQEMKSSVENWKETVEPHQENINEYLDQIEVSLKELEDKIKQ